MWRDAHAAVSVADAVARYPGTQGSERFAEAVVRLRRYERDEEIDGSLVVATHGGMDALCHALAALPPGSPVVHPTPGWVFGIPVQRAGHFPVALPWALREPFSTWLDRLEHWLATTRPTSVAVLVNSPRNPSGAPTTAVDWARLVELSNRFDAWLVIDDVYGFQDPTDRRALRNCPRVVVCDSVSKRLAAPGLRLGYVVATPECLPRVRASAAEVSVGVSPLVTQLGSVAIDEFVRAELPDVLRRALTVRSAAVRDVWRGDDELLLLREGSYYGCVFLPGHVDGARVRDDVRERGFKLAAGSDDDGFYLRFCLASSPRVHEAVRCICDTIRE